MISRFRLARYRAWCAAVFDEHYDASPRWLGLFHWRYFDRSEADYLLPYSRCPWGLLGSAGFADMRIFIRRRWHVAAMGDRLGPAYSRYAFYLKNWNFTARLVSKMRIYPCYVRQLYTHFHDFSAAEGFWNRLADQKQALRRYLHLHGPSISGWWWAGIASLDSIYIFRLGFVWHLRLPCFPAARMPICYFHIDAGIMRAAAMIFMAFRALCVAALIIITYFIVIHSL